MFPFMLPYYREIGRFCHLPDTVRVTVNVLSYIILGVVKIRCPLLLAAAAGCWPTGSRESSRDSRWNETGLTGHFSTVKVER
jgi:hypothetical protein